MADPATGRRVSVQGAYPESASADMASIAQDQRDVIEFGSTQWPGIPWPYPKSTVFVGGADEEYPMMANDTAGPPLPGLPVTPKFVAAHELLHSYFPFLMGVNEQRYPILDEGWTTAFEYLFNAQDLQPGLEDALFAAIRAANITPAWSGVEIPAITAADSLRGLAASENAYGKASMAYLALRSLLGDDAFKAGLQGFIERWQGKHPLPVGHVQHVRGRHGRGPDLVLAELVLLGRLRGPGDRGSHRVRWQLRGGGEEHGRVRGPLRRPGDLRRRQHGSGQPGPGRLEGLAGRSDHPARESRGADAGGGLGGPLRRCRADRQHLDQPERAAAVGGATVGGAIVRPLGRSRPSGGSTRSRVACSKAYAYPSSWRVGARLGR